MTRWRGQGSQAPARTRGTGPGLSLSHCRPRIHGGEACKCAALHLHAGYSLQEPAELTASSRSVRLPRVSVPRRRKPSCTERRGSLQGAGLVLGRLPQHNGRALAVWPWSRQEAGEAAAGHKRVSRRDDIILTLNTPTQRPRRPGIVTILVQRYFT